MRTDPGVWPTSSQDEQIGGNDILHVEKVSLGIEIADPDDRRPKTRFGPCNLRGDRRHEQRLSLTWPGVIEGPDPDGIEPSQGYLANGKISCCLGHRIDIAGLERRILANGEEAVAGMAINLARAHMEEPAVRHEPQAGLGEITGAEDIHLPGEIGIKGGGPVRGKGCQMDEAGWPHLGNEIQHGLAAGDVETAPGDALVPSPRGQGDPGRNHRRLGHRGAQGRQKMAADEA